MGKFNKTNTHPTIDTITLDISNNTLFKYTGGKTKINEFFTDLIHDSIKLDYEKPT